MKKKRNKSFFRGLATAAATLGLTTATFAQDSGVYDHLMSDTFYYRSGNTRWGERFETLSKAFLEVLLPFMAIFGITNIVLSMSASVIYLSRPEFFDKVHILKYLRRQMKGAGGKKFGKFQQMMKDLGLSGTFIVTFVPDFKALAFYDAAELGEDGRPSITTFLKRGFPKYAAILALVIMISDGTFMNINLKAAEVSRWFFKKAESYDYIHSLEKYSQQGAKYKVPYTGGKKKIFSTVYETALSLDNSITASSQTYREQVGSRVDAWVNQNFQDSDFEGTTVAAKARATTVPVISQGNSTNQEGNRVYQIPVGEFGVSPETDAQYIVLEVTFQSKNNILMNPTYSTTNPAAWSGSGNSVTLDVMKLSQLAGIDPASVKVTRTTEDVRPAGTTVTPGAPGRTLTFTMSDSNWKALTVQVYYTVNGRNYTVQVTYANPSPSNNTGNQGTTP